METRGLDQEIVAIIPARGGSKGLPNKNIRELNGKPLIAYSIEVALQSELIDRVILSTDSEEIAEVGREYGAEVPFLRPTNLATDRALITSALDHLMQELYGESWRHSKALVVLYPTSPFRTPGLVDYLISKFAEGYTSVSTAKKISPAAGDYFTGNNGSLRPLFTDSEGFSHVHRNYGVFTGNSFDYPPRSFCHYIDNPASFIDIDYLEDFQTAEEIVRRGLFDFTDTRRPDGNGVVGR